MSYTKKDLAALGSFYSQQLLESTLPFWFPRSLDTEHGGYLLMRDHDGTLLDDDKAVWIQGRATWLLATLYNTVEPKIEWLEGAKSGIDFLNKHCFQHHNGSVNFAFDFLGVVCQTDILYNSSSFQSC